MTDTPPSSNTPATLAPPPHHSRPSSAGSNRSANSSSRRGRSTQHSANVSRSNSVSSRAHSDASGSASASTNTDRVKKSGATTTISGGLTLGNRPPEAAGRSRGRGGAGRSKAQGQGQGQGSQGARSGSTSPQPPAQSAPPPSADANANANGHSANGASGANDANAHANGGLGTASGPTSDGAPRSIHINTHLSKTALEAARDAATMQHIAHSPPGDALTSLQKMISDLKGLPPVANPPPASDGSSAPGSRSASGSNAKMDTAAIKSPPTNSTPLAIPASSSGSAGSKKLKADAPSFTPSFQPQSVSPVASGLSISPVAPMPLPVADQRRASHGAHAPPTHVPAHRLSSSSSQVRAPMANLPTSPLGYAQGLPPLNYGMGYQSNLGMLPETTDDTFAPMYSQEQLAQQLYAQYQAIQILQAQLAANQLAQQQVTQQVQQQAQQAGGFIAPRFQALAQQRLAQQQQQAQQLAQAQAQAQQAFDLQQQQMLQQQQQLAEAQAVREATLKNPPPVFDEDDEPNVVGPTGRPQLAPSFTFGAKQPPKAAAPIREDTISPTSQPITINRSEGIGGAQATGLAGLAARAHKRTGSEITPAMQQQLELQSQIEALQAKQKALMQEEMAEHVSPLQDLSTVLQNQQRQTPSQTIARHRRVQSSLPSASLPEVFDNPPELPEASIPQQTTRGFGENQVTTGHNRRHSINAFNKSAGHGPGFSISGMSSLGDVPEGLPNGGGHHRSGSRGGFESGNWRNGGAMPGNNAVADLAAAQAQLQSLGQFRAAAGGGHSKMASFSFPNMLPNLLAATTLQAPAGQTLWQQQQAFQMQLQQTTQGPQRKSLFAPYLPQTSLPPLLSAGKLVVGILRVNKKNRSDAYVATDVLEADIYICGSKDRNRALEGDIVAVELLDVDEVWSTKKDKEEKKRKKEENAAYDFKPSTSVAKKLEKKKDDVEVEGQGLTLFDDEEVNDDTKPTYAGHVVAVVERMPGQLFSGQLGVLRPSSAATKEKQELERREREGDRGNKRKDERDESEAKPKIVWFKPTDKRVPLIAIPTEQAPPDFIDNPDAYVDRLFVATIKRWPITSLHPFGTLVEELGPIGDPEVETSALLKDCNFPTEDFSEASLKCLPPLPFSIPDREYEIRTDLRNERVFTIDPPTAKDLDDALSIKRNDDGNYLVGVHIADVSYFVKMNTALDREARKRATSVYLVQRAVPMLPPQLSEELCSLRPHEDRLTFSAMFIIDKDGQVLDKSFGRSIIKSCGKLAYGDAQRVINGDSLPSGKIFGHSSTDVESDLRALHSIAKNLRQRRLDNGAMTSNKHRVAFVLDDEGRPVDCAAQNRIEANNLVEEFMLLANISVAQFIAHGLPEQSLLRRHEPPIERRLEGFVNRAHKLGFDFDGSSSASLQKSFNSVQDPDVLVCLELLKKKSMQRARYFCTGMLDIAKYSHWALNTPLYTHFSSPIRRYADVLVHRMLDACLASPNPNDVKFHMDRDAVAKCAQQCNMKKASAKLAEEQSIHLHLCMLIHDLTEKYGPVIREGRVLGVLDAAFDVFIPEFGIEKRVHVDKMPVNNTVFDEHKDILSLYWTNQDVLSFLAEATEDPHLEKIKALGDRHAAGHSTRSADAAKLFDGASSTTPSSATSVQYAKSASHSPLEFEGLRISGEHKIQDVRELMKIPVIVTSDMTKSPPVLVVYACNPYAN